MTVTIHNRNRQFSQSRGAADRPRGAVLVAALVCLLVVMSIVGAMLQGAVRARRHLHVERDRRQCELLVQAGADRAAFRLSAEPEYRGETWLAPAVLGAGRGDGQVAIEASRDGEDQPWQVRVVAEYPRGGELSIRRSRTFIIQSPATQVQE